MASKIFLLLPFLVDWMKPICVSCLSHLETLGLVHHHLMLT